MPLGPCTFYTRVGCRKDSPKSVESLFRNLLWRTHRRPTDRWRQRVAQFGRDFVENDRKSCRQFMERERKKLSSASSFMLEFLAARLFAPFVRSFAEKRTDEALIRRKRGERMLVPSFLRFLLAFGSFAAGEKKTPIDALQATLLAPKRKEKTFFSSACIHSVAKSGGKEFFFLTLLFHFPPFPNERPMRSQPRIYNLRRRVATRREPKGEIQS